MKIIGITGNNRELVILMLFEYFKIIKTEIGVFNGENYYDSRSTNIKPIKTLDEVINTLNRENTNKINLLLVDVSLESVLFKSDLTHTQFDLLLLTNFDDVSHDSFKDFDHYLEMINKMFSYQKKAILPQSLLPFELKRTDIKRFGLESDCEYQGYITRNDINGLEIVYKNRTLKARLISRLNAINILATISVLEELSYYKYKKFKKLINKFSLNGYLETFKYKNKTIVLDGSVHRMKQIIDELGITFGHYNFKIILDDYTKGNNELVNRRNSANGKALMKAKHIYVVNEEETFIKDFIKDVLNNKSHSIEIINSNIEAIKLGIKNIKKDEVLIVFSRKDIDIYRGYLEDNYGTI